MSIDYYKDKYIQVLQDKISLQERVNALFSEVNDLKAQLLKPKKHHPKGTNTRRRSIQQESEEDDEEFQTQDTSESVSSDSECDGDPWDMIPLKTVIDDRHSGTIGMLTNRDKEVLKRATSQFLKKYKLENGPNFIPRGFINKYNSYLDRKIDEGLFDTPKVKKRKRVYKVVVSI